MLLHPGEKFKFNGGDYHYPNIKLMYWAGGNPFHHHQDINRLLQGWKNLDTIITNEWCANNINQLQIIDITDIFEPTQVGVYNMFAPYGLAVRGDYVWVCDAESGIKIVDISDKANPTVVHFIEGYDARDVILIDTTAYVVTTSGIVIYDVSTFDSPVQIGIQEL